ncbi:NnrS family protein [Sulfurovum sp.]|uniref:NnrS family protein n=3 Tax=Sulfurovum sp. TaxID=1969726 RepID=UPI0025E819AB|nr:NnrS family protein [Sulfurovum sp.]
MHMNFSEEAEDSYFFSQPHQPFFILAFISALAGMLLFMLSYKGILNLSVSPVGFHVYVFTYLMFTPAFFGFLFTTFPRFTATPPIDKSVYMRIFSFYYIGATLILLGSIVTPVFSGIGMSIVFIGHFMGTQVLRKIYKTTVMEDKHDIFWILTAMSIGVFAHFLFIIAAFFYAPLMGLSIEISVYLFLFLLTFSVAQRMVPFFSHCTVERNPYLMRSIFILLILHILLEGFYTNSSFIVDLLIGVLIAKELHRWKLPFPNPNPLLWILHIALFWVPVAFILSGLVNLVTLLSGISFLALDIHMLVLGFVLTILIGFGTRVTIGHSGNMLQADKWTTLLFYWTQVVVVSRILVSLAAALGYHFIILFDISATAWLLLFIVWAVRFFDVLIRGKKLTS